MEDFKQKYQQEIENFLAKAAELLITHNWGEELLHSVERALNMQLNYNQILFPGGMAEILLKFEQWQNSKMLSLLNQIEKPIKIREKIALALKVRIMDIISKKALFNHLSYSSLPFFIFQNMQNQLVVSDLIWRFAGDESTDFNYYTKRGLLVSVYAPSQAFYMNDDSKDYIETQKFIENSLNQVVNLAKLVKR